MASGMLAVTTALAASGTGVATAQGAADDSLVGVEGDGLQVELADHWFVELHGRPTADGASPASVAAEQANFRSQVATARIALRERGSFSTLFNGLSVDVGPAGLAALSRLPGVKAMYPVEAVALPDLVTASEPDLATALQMTGASLAQSELGYTGAGVKVGVIDSGIDYDHPDLGAGFGPGFRVTTGWDFVGDDYTGSNSPVPDADPDDCGGHGTHVAGIVGASGAVTGVAPEVELASYRVFGCDGFTQSDIMLAAMERALADGMDVVNISIGASFQWPQYPTAAAANRLVNKGVVVVASIGNSGVSGPYAASAPGVAERVIGVASFSSTSQRLGGFTVSPDDREFTFAVPDGAVAPGSGSLPLARTGTPASASDACTPLPPGSLAGSAALVRRGGCSFAQKVTWAQQAGAAAVLVYNTAPTMFAGSLGGLVPAIPVVFISGVDGEELDARVATGPTVMTWQVGRPIAAQISSFSSYGLSPDLTVKPDLGAPGGAIYSTFPLELGGYATLGGTSMASPHVAGAAALLLEARPSTPAAAVRAIFQNTADPQPSTVNLAAVEPVQRQGAGLLDVDDAILSTSRVEPSVIATGEGEAGPVTKRLTVTNETGAPVSYALGHVAATSTGPSNFLTTFAYDPASVSYTVDAVPIETVTVAAGGSSSVDVTIAASALLPNGSTYGGHLTLTPETGPPLRVPYAGIAGDYQSRVALSPPGGFTFLPSMGAYFSDQGGWDVVPAGRTFTMVGPDIPYVLLQLGHPVRSLRVDVEDARGRAMGYAWTADYVARTPGSTNYSAIPLDGTTKRGNRATVLADGSYVAVVSVLKAGGDSANPAHWEKVRLDPFVIDRP